MTGSETCFGEDNLFACALLEVHEEGSLKIAGACPARWGDHARDEDHSLFRVSNSKRLPLPVRNDRLVVVNDERGINNEEADIGTIGTLKPSERCYFFPSDQPETLAVVKANEAFL